MKSPAQWILAGLLVAAAGLAWGLIPRSEEYSDFGFGTAGLVDVQCGSAFSEDVDPQFRDREEGRIYRADLRSGYDPPIFGGRTATQVCEDLVNGPRTVAIAGLAGGALLALVGLIGVSGSNGTAPVASDEPGSSPPSPESPPPPTPTPPPAPPPSPPGPPASVHTPPAVAPVATPASRSELPPEAARSARAPILEFGDGQQIDLVDQIVVGRDPTPPIDSASALPIVVSDATVSKTHLRVGVTGDEVWIEDLHSRNGVSIVAAEGSTMTAAPGRRVILDVGDRVIAGDSTTFTLVGPSPDSPGRIV